MIQSTLEAITNALNQYLLKKINLDESIVLLNRIVDSNGSIPLSNQNKLVLSLINIEKETAKPYYSGNQKQSDGSYSIENRQERYNLSVLLSANFNDYNEALKFLNAGISFFQTYPIFDKNNFSTLPSNLEKLVFEMDKIDFHQMHNLWTSLGANYQPSVVYKVSIVSKLETS